MSNKGIFYTNGKYVEAGSAAVPLKDLVVLRGYGVFDLLLAPNGNPLRLDKNVARLRRSCNHIELNLRWTDEEIIQIVSETLRQNQEVYPSGTNFSIRIIVTGGLSADNITPNLDNSGLYVLVEEFKGYPQHIYEKGVKFVVVKMARLFPNAKTILYTPAIIAQKRAAEQGGYEAVYADSNNNILEGTTCNLFCLINDEWVTPPEDEILAGITRMTILQLAEKHGWKINVRRLTYDEFIGATEVFACNATKKILPVTTIDSHTVGSGLVGEKTKQIMSVYNELFEIRARGEALDLP